MTIDEIRELIKVLTETGVAELEVQRGEDRVRIRRSLGENNQDIVVTGTASAPASAASASSGPTTPASNPTGSASAPLADELSDVATDPSLIIVKSPIVGTFYDAPSPGAPSFVQPGDSVQPGHVLCIIESMKLMNEIEAEFAGVVVSKLVANAQPVEYGEALFALRPA
jgi:acetyl-CoA carboxylase biotin carboxyl carrier protein